jgi:hypothetical protein
LESPGISRNISGIFWNMLEYLGMFWNILKYVGIQQVFTAPPAALRAIRAISTSAPSPLSVASGGGGGAGGAGGRHQSRRCLPRIFGHLLNLGWSYDDIS